MRVLVIVAHPDDEVLGCGGNIARLSREGHEVSIAIIGEGATSRFSHREQASRDLVKDLQSCSRQAAKILGAKEVFFYDQPDNRFDTVPLIEIVKIIEDLIERISPEAIFSHNGSDLNIDHMIVHRAVLTATRPIHGQRVKDVYAFEVASSSEWTFQQFVPQFRSNMFVNIIDTLETKIQAMQLYQSEIRPFPHPRSLEAIRINASKWGSMVGLEAAEPFELIRSIK